MPINEYVISKAPNDKTAIDIEFFIVSRLAYSATRDKVCDTGTILD